MARPANATDEEVLKHIEGLLESGKKLSDISPSGLQNTFGGRYDRHKRLLDEAKEEFADRHIEPIPKMPRWFEETVTELSEKFEDIWSTVSRNIRETVESEVSGVEAQKTELRREMSDQLEQISRLEDEVEALSKDFEKSTEEVKALSQRVTELEKENAVLTVEAKNLKEAKAELSNRYDNERSEAASYRKELELVRGERDMLKGQLAALQSQNKK